jgi:hypothetical protein
MKTKLLLFFLLIGLFMSIKASAQISADSLNPTLLEPTSICIDQFQCRFVENEASCFIKLPPSNGYLTIETEQALDTNTVNIANVSVYKITPVGLELIFYFDYSVEFIGLIEVPEIEVGAEYFVSVKRNEFKPCLSCETESRKFSFCLKNTPKATPCLSPTPGPCQLVCNGSFESYLSGQSPNCLGQLWKLRDYNMGFWKE